MRKTTNYFIIRFNDLTKDKQNEIKKDLYEKITKDKEMIAYLTEAQSHEYEPIKIEDHISGAIERGCGSAWYELGIGTEL